MLYLANKYKCSIATKPFYVGLDVRCIKNKNRLR